MDVPLPRRINVDQARGLHEAFTAAIVSEGDVELDFSDVISIDTAGFQLLLLLQITLARGKRRCICSAVSTNILDDARLLGVAPWLELA